MNTYQKPTSWRHVSEEAYIKMHAELAAKGVTLAMNQGKAGETPKRSDLLSDRANLRRTVTALGEDARKAIDNKDRKRADDLMEIMETIGLFIDGITRELDMQDVADAKNAERTQETGWRTKEGKPVTVLARDQKLTDLPSNDRSDGRPRVGFGEAIKAMALGTNNADIRAALSEGTDSAGGYSVPAYLRGEIVDKMRARTVCIRAGAQTVLLETQKTTIARLASDPVAGWRLENAAIAESDPTFSGLTFTTRSLAVLVKISRELLEDSINLDQAMNNAFAGAMAVSLDRVALFGSGTAPEPRGVFNDSDVGVVSMGTNGAALADYDKLLDLQQTLQDENAADITGLIMAPRTSTAYAKLKDSTGQPLRKPEAISTLPFMTTTIVPINQTQGSASNASCVIAGDFTQMFIGVRTELRIELLRELFAENHQYAFVAHMRADVQLVTPESFAVLKGIIP